MLVIDCGQPKILRNNLASNNVKVLKSKYSTEQFRTKANINVGIGAGDAIIIAQTNYVDIMVDGGPTRGTNVWVGISDGNSSNTASLDGVLNVALVGPGVILQAQAKTPANINTDAKILAILNKTTSFARSASTVAGILTINETTGITAPGSSTASLFIISCDPVKGSMRVAYTGSGFIDGGAGTW